MPGGILASLEPLFKPRTVAVIGASRTPGKQGHTAIKYLRRAGFAGGIFPINQAGGEIEGLTCYRSVAAVPERIDCALMVIPAAGTVAAVEECAELGVRSLIIGSTGFAELGTEEGRALQAAIVRIARSSGIKILGPNTNGIFNASDKFSLGYNTSHGDALTPGPVSIAAHSGALFNALAPRLRELGAGLSKFVPVGNEADLSMLDFVEYFIADPDTGVIGLIIEGISDGARFRALVEKARAAGKPIVALKLGRSKAGAGATVAHSSRLAGSARAFDAFFREEGIASVPTVEAMAGACAVLLATRPGTRSHDTSLVCVTTTGGGASLIADFCAERGLKLAGNPDGSWSGTVSRLIASYRDVGIIGNPTDTGSLGGKQERMNDLFAAQEEDGFSGPVMVFTHSLPTLSGSQHFAEMMIARQKRTGSPVVIVAPGGLADGIVQHYVEAGVPFFRDVATAFDSLKAYYDTLPQAPAHSIPKGERIAEISARLSSADGPLSELDSAAILRLVGIPVVESHVVADLRSARVTARAIGQPVVLKAMAPGVAHKNQLGFVMTNITEDGLDDAYARLEGRMAASGYRRDQVTLVLQPMIPAAAELIAGVSWEEPLGHFLVAGLGGVQAEVLDEVMLLPVPVSPATIRSRVAESRIGRLVRRIGGDTAVTAVVETLDRLQRLVSVHADDILSIDINPLLVGETGSMAVDALIVPKPHRPVQTYRGT
jgi:acyl-CoA synthetase (NDP forming)